MKWSSFFVPVVAAAMLLTTACGFKKTADDMKNTTKRVEDSSKHLEKRTDDLHNDMTYKESNEVMMREMDRLFGETAQENRSPVNSILDYFLGINNEPDLFLDAGTTILAMHFQFWKGDYNDNMTELDSRLMWGIEALMLRLFKHTPRDGNVDVLRPNRSFRGVGALGVKLDLVSDRLHQTLAANGLPDSILYDLIVTALKNRDAVKRNEQFPRATAKLLQWQPEAVYLLQLRHNILPLMVVSRMTDFQERSDLGRFLMQMTGQSVTLSSVNPEQLQEWTSWLEKASQTRQDLRDMGITPQYNTILNRIIAGVDFDQADIVKKFDASTAGPRAQLEFRFARAYARVIQEYKSTLPVVAVKKASVPLSFRPN
jgi:hypothetical protein